MSTAAERNKARRARRPIYVTVRRLVDPATGEELGALVPASPMDQRLMRERKYAVGAEIRAELKQPRNSAFHRLAHAIGVLLVENVEEFQNIDSHAALKAVQAKSGVCCDPEKFVIDLGQFGRHEVERMVPRSLSYDCMSQEDFSQFFDGITAYIGEHYAGVMLDEVRDEFWRMCNGETDGYAHRRAA